MYAVFLSISVIPPDTENVTWFLSTSPCAVVVVTTAGDANVIPDTVFSLYKSCCNRAFTSSFLKVIDDNVCVS